MAPPNYDGIVRNTLARMKFCHSNKNKAGYTATKIACGWAGAVKTGQCKHLDKSSNAKDAKKAIKANGDQQTDRPTNRQTKRVKESRVRA